MIYRSNLECPDLTQHFKHLHIRPMPHSMGHSVASDWADKADDDPVFGLYKRCGLQTHDEVAILYNIAKQAVGRKGCWLDIGGHTGWTAVHAISAIRDDRSYVVSVDPMYAVAEFLERTRENVYACGLDSDLCYAYWQWEGVTSDQFFLTDSFRFDGVMIDGDHMHPHPLNDAINAHRFISEDGVIMFHDSWGEPCYSAARALMDLGYRAKLYNTPHGVIACTRSKSFVFPEHVPDPRINWARMRSSMHGFPLERLE